MINLGRKIFETEKGFKTVRSRKLAIIDLRDRESYATECVSAMLDLKLSITPNKFFI